MTTEEKRMRLIGLCHSTMECTDGCKFYNAPFSCNFAAMSKSELEGAYEYVFGEKEASSNVDHPEHYQGAHECIDVMRAMFGDEAVAAFCRCNAFKYRFRASRKNGEEDIKKAEWYENYLINMQEGKKCT